MKKALLTILISLTGIVVFGQVRLGSSIEEVKSEFWRSELNPTEGYDSDGDYYITVEFEKAIVQYFFREDEICNLAFLTPKSQGALNFYVELYNKQFVIISDTEWKMYSENGIANIRLIFPEDGRLFFAWN